uniref:ATP synthase F0 subunit 8 n=1 Tax=Pheidole yeensis TaxID=367159 RepID=UPI0025794B63|nr:ATP synthase F0 subunit 8 [Pheidole yeensis]WGV34082.1 ATP synthase F0 subunit 8 [Pheidole yeensis]
MPQMSPMLWMMILMFTLSILMVIIIFIYFLNLPTILYPTSYQKTTKFIKWNWLW